MENSLNRNLSLLSLIKITLPIVIMMVFFAMYSIVDGMFVSRFVGPNALSAINIVYPVISMLIGNILTFSLASVLPASMPFVLSYKDGALVSLLFIAIALLSSLFSIRKIRKVDAICAIGGNY